MGDLLIELHLDVPEGHHLRLRSMSAEEAGEPSGLVIDLGEVRPLAAAEAERLAPHSHRRANPGTSAGTEPGTGGGVKPNALRC